MRPSQSIHFPFNFEGWFPSSDIVFCSFFLGGPGAGGCLAKLSKLTAPLNIHLAGVQPLRMMVLGQREREAKPGISEGARETRAMSGGVWFVSSNSFFGLEASTHPSRILGSGTGDAEAALEAA